MQLAITHIRYAIIAKVLGVLLMLFSLTLLSPLLISLIYEDQQIVPFAIAFAVTFCTGLLVWLPAAQVRQDLRIKDGFLVVSLFWFVLGVFGALPFILSTVGSLDVTDAVFESISGLTTTGATVITGIDELPKSILYYRQQLQWLGGIGIIVIAVAILPMLGIGGMQLYRAETPGPVKDSKLTPRITETAKALFLIYVSLTVICTLAYWAVGMTAFDALGHAFSTVAIGGFSTHDASMAYFNSNKVLLVSIVFMLLAGMNFALHFIAWRQKDVRQYFADPEWRFYMRMTALGCLIVAAGLYFMNVYDAEHAIILGSFKLVSIMTTTGFGVADFSMWPSFLPVFIFMFSFMGGCAGSTGGGLKMIRIMLIIKQGAREIKRLIHPNAVIPIKIGTQKIPGRIVDAVWGFVAAYSLLYFIMVIILMATGLDFLSAFSAVGAAINNLGPGLGEVAANFQSVSDFGKWTLCFAMLLGRLEVFTLLVLFTPTFWRQ